MIAACTAGAGEPEPPAILHAAALRRADSGFTAPADVSDSPNDDEAVRLHGFELQSPARLAGHRHTVASQSYIARTSLLNAETLIDPGLDIAEDAYLFKLLCLTSLPRFVPDMTSIIHDGAADQSGFARSLGVTAALERLSYRLLGRTFPYRTSFVEQGPLGPLGVVVPQPMASGRTGIAPRALALHEPSDGTSQPFRCTGGALRVTAYGEGRGGTCRLRYRAGDRVLADCAVSTVPLAVSGFWRAALDLGVRPVEAGDDHLVEARTDPGQRLLGLTIETIGAGLEVAWTELPDGPIWIYGAGNAGERAADCLEAETGRRPAGFIDSYKRGLLRDLPIIGIEDVERTPTVSLVIASQYVGAIVELLRKNRFESLYTAYPPLQRKLIFLG